MYWFRNGIEKQLAKRFKKEWIKLAIAFCGDGYNHEDASIFQLIQERWEDMENFHAILNDRHAFQMLPTSDQIHLMLDFYHLLYAEKERSIAHWHQQLKPWVIRLQEIVLDKFEVLDYAIDPDTTKVLQLGKIESNFTFQIPSSRSFCLRLFNYGCDAEHDTYYPHVYVITDQKNAYSMNGPFPELVKKNIRNLQKNHPKKFQEYLRWEQLDRKIWKQWHDEMKQAGVIYEPIYQPKT